MTPRKCLTYYASVWRACLGGIANCFLETPGRSWICSVDTNGQPTNLAAPFKVICSCRYRYLSVRSPGNIATAVLPNMPHKPYLQDTIAPMKSRQQAALCQKVKYFWLSDDRRTLERRLA